MRKVLSIFVVFLLFFAVGIVYAEDSVTSSSSVGVGSGTVVTTCQNYPPPNYCPTGKAIYANGVDSNGCTIWSCTVCKNPGEIWKVNPETRNYSCCKGSYTLKAEIVNSTICKTTQDVGMCSECGNGICESWENTCNCPSDCKTDSTPTPSLVKDVPPAGGREGPMRDNIKEKVIEKIDARVKNIGDRSNPDMMGPQRGLAIGIMCNVSTDLETRLELLRLEFDNASTSGDINASKEIKQQLSELTDKIQFERRQCMDRILNNSKDNTEIVGYYRQRMMDVINDSNNDSRLENMRQLRTEMDETIKNMVENRKKIRFDEISQMAQDIKIRAGHIDVGNSTANTTDSEIELEMNGRNISFRPSRMGVMMRDARFNFTNITASDITVNGSGIYVNGTLVKMLPSAVFEHNKNMMNNAKRMINMTLEKEGEKAVYKATYNAKKRILGIFPANARTETTVDANTGEVISEKKPWWSGMSSDVKDTASTDNSTNTTATG